MRIASLLLGLMVSAALHAEPIRLGTLTLDWPAGYKLKATAPGTPFELDGPLGSTVMVTVMQAGPVQALSAAASDHLQATLKSVLNAQAQQAGKVVLPLTLQTLPDGSLLQVIGSEVALAFKTGYFLQAALQSRQGQIALLTFEGLGDATDEAERLQGLFDSTHWDSDAAEQAAFTNRVAVLLRTQLGADSVLVAEPLTLKLGGLQANLDRVFAYCRSNEQGCEAELDRYVQTVVELHQREQAPITTESLRVAVRTEEFFREATLTTAGGELLHRPVAAGLVALVMVDSASSATALQAADAKRLGITADQAFERGLLNTRNALQPIGQMTQGRRQSGVEMLSGEYYESSRLLFPEEWAPLAKAQAGVLIVALPAKDLLLYSADDSPAGLAALQARAREVMRRSPGPLSDQLLRWSTTGWQPVP